MNDHSQFMTLEIDAVIAQAKAMQGFARALQFAEMEQITFKNFLGQAAKFAEDVKLQLARHPGQFRRANRIEDDLKLHGDKLKVQCAGGRESIDLKKI